MMRVFKGLDNLPPFKNPVLTIGTFDGVHLGHAKIIERLRKKAIEVDGESIIITFDPHPRFVVAPNSTPIELLSTSQEKIKALQALHVDNVVIVPFTKAFSDISAEAYIRDFIVSNFHPHTIIIGYDHHFGKNRQGNYQLLESVKATYGFQLEEISVQEIEHIAVSSTKIRAALHIGDIKKANELAGKYYTLEGVVIHGEKRGRLIGFPTANVHVGDAHKLIPANGVYAVKAYLKETVYKAMLNIGVRPTVSSSNHRSIEVNIIDFDQDIYDETLRIEFVDKLRDEIKFNGIDELIAQLTIDKQDALSRF
ncbi:MAG: bifunctional riboflavin kinase/FAD synthetase [Chitinophagaceae bacterium]|nr:bifunctional riboflavin kinase/FAD synthetase [Chitinophagaceae bacterium]